MIADGATSRAVPLGGPPETGIGPALEPTAGPARPSPPARRRAWPLAVAYPTLGIALLLGAWWWAAAVLAADPRLQAFTSFAPEPAFAAFWTLLENGEMAEAAQASLARVGIGLIWAIGIGLPMGLLIGGSAVVRQVTHLPFQFLRMVSPLAWMPVAVLVFATWDGAIEFLIAAATVWPIAYSTASGVRKVDPTWFKVARNLGASPWQMLRAVTFPAVIQDVLTGVRLALGVAWIVLVPAEYLGVTSGLGYAINDARDTLSYDDLAAIVLAIGLIGFTLDGLCLAALRRWSWHEQR